MGFEVDFRTGGSSVSAWLLVDSDDDLTRSEDLWYQDGTVVLRAESTLFRVYTGILEARSPVFRDMFSFCQAEEQEMMEDCPLISLQDSAVDLTHFLKAIFDSGFYVKSSKATFPVIAGILRLSTKYNVSYLRQRAISQLAKMYPASLDQWDQQPFSRSPDCDFAALNLARETDVPVVLPGIMYRCCAYYSVAAICDGVPMPDGSHIGMNAEDKRICLIARDSLLIEKREKVFAFLGSGEHPNCVAKDICNARRLDWVHELGYSCCVFEESFDWDHFGEFVCPDCFDEAKAHFKRARRELWNRLPSFFGLPTWDELRKISSI